MPRFAVLTHDHPTLHWDLLLEDGDGLRTFRLAAPPHVGTTIDAEPLRPHRTHYLDYEGPVSGNRGTVTRWDAGEFDWLTDTPAVVACELRGARFRGVVRLTTTQDTRWTATFAAQNP